MATATVPVKLLVMASLVMMLVLGLAIGYVVSDATRSEMPMRMMSGMDVGDMTDRMGDMSTHMERQGMDMSSMMGSGSKTGAMGLPATHYYD